MKKNLILFNIRTDSDHDVLGITTPLINSFAKKFDKVYVISTSVGKLKVYNNVEVYSLGGEYKNNSVEKLFNFYILLFKVLYRAGTNISAFVHMVPLYATLAWPILRPLKIPITLWYVHKKINLNLKVASFLVNRIATVDKNTFMLKVKNKLHYLDHGITFPNFFCKPKSGHLKYNLAIVGRISRIKHIDCLINAIIILKKKSKLNLVLHIYGSPITNEDLVYKNELLALILENNIKSNVIFHGSVKHSEIFNRIRTASLMFNLSNSGLDKSGLEALAFGIPLIYTHPSYNKIFKKLKIDYSDCYLPRIDHNLLAKKILNFLNTKNKSLSKPLIEFIRSKYSVDSLVSRLIPILLMK
jgi:glycosyltransferase involved in cell wall biosynthesis